MYYDKYGHPRYTIEDSVLITPEMASELLTNHKCPKPLDSKELALLVSELKGGTFDFNGATIALDSNGRLIDGRLRLAACVEANVPFRTFIVWGVTEEGKLTKDTGRPRNIVQYLDKHEYRHPRSLSAAAKILHRMETTTGSKEGIIGNVRDRITHKSIMDTISAHPNLIKSVDLIKSQDGIFLTTALNHLIVLDYLTRYVDNKPEIADEFLEVLSNQRAADVEHPVYALRQILHNGLYKSNSNLKGDKQVALMIVAYNYLKTGKSVKRLRLPNEEPKLFMISEHGDA